MLGQILFSHTNQFISEQVSDLFERQKMAGLHAFTVHVKKGFTLRIFCIALSMLLIIFVISD